MAVRVALVVAEAQTKEIRAVNSEVGLHKKKQNNQHGEVPQEPLEALGNAAAISQAASQAGHHGHPSLIENKNNKEPRTNATKDYAVGYESHDIVTCVQFTSALAQNK